VGALVLALLAPGAALAATAEIDNGVLVVRGTDGADNVEVRYADANGPAIGVQEQFNTVQAGPGCAPDGNGAVLCPYNGTSSVEVDLGDGDDELFVEVGLPLSAAGGNGDDRMFWRSGTSPHPEAPVRFDGGAGDDRLGGGLGDDVLSGGPGDDGIDASDGNDRIDPGPGEDSVTDSGGDDHVDARDGAADHVDCGAGTDTGDFDPFDVARGCELGNLPARAAPDCTPEIEPIAAVSFSSLRRRRALTVRATAEAGCTLRARIAVGSGVTVAAATAPTQRGSVRIRLGDTALRRIRRARRFTVWVLASAPGAPTVRRRFSVRLHRGGLRR
jgi:hypothetical protein